MASLEVNAKGVSIGQWPKLLAALVQASVKQRQRGLPPLSALRHIRYKREPARREIWQTAARTAQLGYGDCEDLAVQLAGDWAYRGYRADVVTRFVRPGLRHALTRVWIPGRGYILIDPSKARGMR